MKTLNQGQEISKFRKGVFDDGPLKPPFIFVFLLLVGLVISLITYYLFFLNSEPNNQLEESLLNILFLFCLTGPLFYYYNLPSKGKNPSVCFFPKYLLVRNEVGEVEVPFKMIKRFRLLENGRKIVVEYREEYMYNVDMKPNKEYIIFENPRLSEDLIVPGPDSINFPQDRITGQEVWGQGEFSFWLIGNSKKINLSIVDELNEKLN